MSETAILQSEASYLDNDDLEETSNIENEVSVPPLKVNRAFNTLSKAIACNLILGIASLVCESIGISEDQKWNRITTHLTPFPIIYKEKYFSGRYLQLDMSNSHVSSVIHMLHRHNKVGFAFVGITSLFIFLCIFHLMAYCIRGSIRTKDAYVDALYIIGGLTMLIMTGMLGAKALFEPSKYTKSAEAIGKYMTQLNCTDRLKPCGIKQRNAIDSDEYDDLTIALIKETVEASASAAEQGRSGNERSAPASLSFSHDQFTEATYWRQALLTCSQNTFFEGAKPKGRDAFNFKFGFIIGGFHYTPEVLGQLGFCDDETLRHIALWLCFAFSLICCLIPCTPWCNVNQGNVLDITVVETTEPETFLQTDKIDKNKLRRLLQSGHITARKALIDIDRVSQHGKVSVTSNYSAENINRNFTSRDSPQNSKKENTPEGAQQPNRSPFEELQEHQGHANAQMMHIVHEKTNKRKH